MEHSYGGMVISKVVDIIHGRIARLVYWGAFVPLNGECLLGMCPPHYVALFDQIAAANDGAVMLPPPIWREAFTNDADGSLSQAAWEQLNPHPYKTFTDPISLSAELASLQVGKSHVNCQQDTALPHSMPWHPQCLEMNPIISKCIKIIGDCKKVPMVIGYQIALSRRRRGFDSVKSGTGISEFQRLAWHLTTVDVPPWDPFG